MKIDETIWEFVEEEFYGTPTPLLKIDEENSVALEEDGSEHECMDWKGKKPEINGDELKLFRTCTGCGLESALIYSRRKHRLCKECGQKAESGEKLCKTHLLELEERNANRIS